MNSRPQGKEEGLSQLGTGPDHQANRGSWTGQLGAQKLISFQILHIFYLINGHWASVSEAAEIFSPFSEAALYDELYESLAICSFVLLLLSSHE